MKRLAKIRFGSGARRRGATWHGILWVLVVAATGLPSAFAQEPYEWPEIKRTEPVEKELTLVQHYHYRERLYDAPVKVETLAEAPASYSGPEEVVAGLVSAMKKFDYEWWLETWDAASRKLIVDRDRAMGVTKEDRLAMWSEKVGATEATFFRWVETGPYIIVTYRRRSAEGEGEEQVVATKLSDSGWTATLELAEDPVFRYVTTDEARIERSIR